MQKPFCTLHLPFHNPLSEVYLDGAMAKAIADAEYVKEIEKARRDLRALISSRNCAPLMLRLAYVTYNL